VAAALRDPLRVAAERARLVRYCAKVTGSADAAEELAQEALLIAWQSRERVADWHEWERWVIGIARNVSLRWRRRTARRAALLAPALGAPADLPDDDLLASRAPAAADPYEELERAERAALLDRALGALPDGARALLVERYVDDLPIAEIAARRGVREETATVQLFRGRQALKRALLAPALRAESEALGLTRGADEPCTGHLEETRIWCPDCGRRRLRAFFGTDDRKHPGSRVFVLSCPDCGAAADGRPGEPFVAHTHKPGSPLPDPLGGVRGYKPALNRLTGWWHAFTRTALADGAVTCSGCGGRSPVAHGIPFDERFPHLAGVPGLYTQCPTCRMTVYIDAAQMAFQTPAAQAFWRDNPRVVLGKPRRVESAQGPLLVTRLESVTGRDAMEFALSASTLETVRVERGGIPVAV
jgi:RNA polymerase sigma-70 factor (ECF subfamily)